MREALAEARQGVGRTHPNPAVGAVVVRGGEVVARGFHARAGAPHAEAAALEAAGPRARGATLYSTLEPCNHFGRTPPCTEAILRAGVGRVVFASSDPNPLVNGAGFRRLREAGLPVQGGVLRAEADALNRPFFKAMRRGLPHVTLKAAISLDGKLATAGGASRWISSEASRLEVHQLRDVVDAVLVGAGTVRADDPLLTTRLPPGGGRHPVRVVLDSRLALPLDRRVFTSGPGLRTVVATTLGADVPAARALVGRGVEVWTVEATAAGHVSLEAVLRRLAREGLLHVLVEGGARVFSHLLAAPGLADELRLYVAPVFLGAAGLAWTGPLQLDAPAHAPRLTLEGLSRVGSDARLDVALDPQGEER